MMRENVGLAGKTTGFMTNGEYIAEGTITLVVERQSTGLCKVSSTVGGGDIARFATDCACRGMRRGARADGTTPKDRRPELLSLPNSTDSDRSTGLSLTLRWSREQESSKCNSWMN